MRIAVSAAALLFLTACSGTPPAGSPASTPPPASPPASSAAMRVYTWGESVTSSGVLLEIGTPVPSDEPVIGINGKPDPARKFVTVPLAVTNKAAGGAAVAVNARVGQQRLDVYSVGRTADANKFLPGEAGKFDRNVRMPVETQGELVLEVYANVEQAKTREIFTFKGPLPS